MKLYGSSQQSHPSKYVKEKNGDSDENDEFPSLGSHMISVPKRILAVESLSCMLVVPISCWPNKHIIVISRTRVSPEDPIQVRLGYAEIIRPV